MPAITHEIKLDFFRFLFEQEHGYVCLATEGYLSDDFKQKFFEWPIQQKELLAYVEKNHKLSRNVWFCINLLSQPTRKKEFCKETNLLWSDLDEASPTEIEPTPQVLIESSPGRYQAVWRLEDKIDPYLAEDYSRRIAYKYRQNGVDPSGWDLTQLLRVPFTRNMKYIDKPLVELLTAHTPLIPVEVFDLLPEAQGTPEELAIDETMPDAQNLPDVEQILYKYSHPLKKTVFFNIYTFEPDEETDWSDKLWHLICVCHEVGMTNEEVFAIAVTSPVNKYKRDKRPMRYLWREVLKADLKLKQITLITAGSAFTMPELIPGEQYDKLSKSIVDEYREWGIKATDASPQYHDLCAVILLSNLLSGNLRLETSYGKMYMNLWGLILGDSTLTRKSTAMRMATEFIGHINRDIVVATDGSVEGLFTGLQTRSGKTSMFFKDEVSGFFDSIKKKEYLSGMPEILTQLYDVPEFFTRRLRKETITITHPVFIFFGGGIKDKMYQLIDEQMVISGFLPRFLIVSGETDLANIRRTGPATPVTTTEKQDMMAKLEKLYKLYNVQTEIEFLGQQVVQAIEVEAFLTPEAWELYGDMEYRLVEQASQSSYQIVALPTFERLSRSLLKMAVLFSAARQKPDNQVIQVTVDDVTHAAKYIQQWGHYSIDLLENLGANASARLIDRVLHTVARKPGILRGEIMRNHKLSRREMDEIQGTLEDRGQMIVTRDGKAIKYTAL